MASFIAALILSGCAALKPKGIEPGTPPDTIKGLAVIELKRKVIVTGRAAVLAKSPGLFRIEVFGAFGQVIALFIGNEKALYAFSDGQERVYSWDDPMLPFSFGPSEIFSFISGIPPEGEEYKVEFNRGGKPKSIVKVHEGSPVLEARLSEYKRVNGSDIPLNISIKGIGEDIAIKYSSVEVNSEIPAGTFDIPDAGMAKSN